MRSTLRYGSRGADVQHLQQLLNKFLHPSVVVTIDGEFGPRTEAAVRIYQASMGISIDGLVGMQTRAALDDVVPHHDIAVSISATSDASWLEVAMKEIGQRERRGPQHNPRILEYHATTSLHATNDETAWCSSFVNWCLRRVNITGTNSASASSWINWGKASHPKTGAITVIQQTTGRSAGSGNHVGFFLQDTGSHIKLLGGNQSNRVKESLYPRSAWRVICCRWPS